MADPVILKKHILGTQLAFAFRWPESGFTFVGKSVKLVLDHESSDLRITFTESGASKKVGSTTTTIDTTAVVISDSNQRISWTRSKAFSITHMPKGMYRGYICWGADADSLQKYLEIQREVATPQRGQL